MSDAILESVTARLVEEGRLTGVAASGTSAAARAGRAAA